MGFWNYKPKVGLSSCRKVFGGYFFRYLSSDLMTKILKIFLKKMNHLCPAFVYVSKGGW